MNEPIKKKSPKRKYKVVKPDFRLTINTDKNADWIKNVGRYRQEEDAAYEECKRREEERRRKEQDKKP